MIDVVSKTKCDFCSDPNPGWEYPARSYRVQSLGVELPVKVNSVEDWLACETCHGFIQRGEWRALAEHTLETLEFGILVPLEIVMAMHQEFRANWIGPPRKVEQR